LTQFLFLGDSNDPASPKNPAAKAPRSEAKKGVKVEDTLRSLPMSTAIVPSSVISMEPNQAKNTARKQIKNPAIAFVLLR